MYKFKKEKIVFYIKNYFCDLPAGSCYRVEKEVFCEEQLESALKKNKKNKYFYFYILLIHINLPYLFFHILYLIRCLCLHLIFLLYLFTIVSLIFFQ